MSAGLAAPVEEAEEALGGRESLRARDIETARRALNELRYAAPGVWRIAMSGALRILGREGARVARVEDFEELCARAIKESPHAIRCACMPEEARQRALRCAGMDATRLEALQWAFSALCARFGPSLWPVVDGATLRTGCLRLFLREVIMAALAGVRG